MGRRLIILFAAELGAMFSWLAWRAWPRVQTLPGWRSGLHILLWAAAMVAMVLYVRGDRRANAAAWGVLGAAVAACAYDIRVKGAAAASTSAWGLVILLIVALMARFAPMPAQAPER